jgi:hypothetical protein
MVGAKGKPAGPRNRFRVATVYAMGWIRIVRPGVDNNKMKGICPVTWDKLRQGLQAG